MTDKATFVAMLDRGGIDYRKVDPQPVPDGFESFDLVVIVEQPTWLNGDAPESYSPAETYFAFAATGKLSSVRLHGPEIFTA